MQLRSHTAVAVVQARAYSSESTLSLETSMCPGYGPKKKKERKKERMKERKERTRQEFKSDLPTSVSSDGHSISFIALCLGGENLHTDCRGVGGRDYTT